jgi:hypothetical protein
MVHHARCPAAKPGEDDMKWLIWSNEHGGWWKPRELGYTHTRSEAGRYDFERALEIVTHANECLRGEHVANETMCPDWEA